MWRLIRLKRELSSGAWEEAISRYKQGLYYILKSGKLIQLDITNLEVEDEVDYLLKRGYEDYSDLLIFSSAFIKGLTLVTEDNELHEIPKKFERYNKVNVVKWSELIKSF